MNVEARVDEGISRSLCNGCHFNNAEACNELFRRYNRRIFNTAYRILGEEASAEDALQETLLNILRGISQFRGEAKISTWITRITINVCLGMLRKSKNKQSADLDDGQAKNLPTESTPLTDPLEHVSLQELKSLVRDTFDRMSEKQKAVVRLHDLEGYTIQEIAEMLGCPAGTVKSRLFYGRKEFKAIFNARSRGGFRMPGRSIQYGCPSAEPL